VKTTVLTISAVSIALAASAAMAQTPADEHAGHHPGAATSPAPSAQVPQGTEPMSTQQLQESMKPMQELMAKIQATKDPAERKRLLQQHSKAMQDQMQKMHQRGDRSAMPKMEMNMGGMHGSATAPPDSDPGSSMGSPMMTQMMRSHEAMQRRMDMMEMMMGQMMQHQHASESTNRQ
jgi:hypothetical protein